jgi:hypothetical protein
LSWTWGAFAEGDVYLLRHRNFDITSHYIHLTFDDLTNKLVQFSPLGIIFGKLGISGKNVGTSRKTAGILR